LKTEIRFADWMFHPEANARLRALWQDPHQRPGWERYSANQPGLYYQPDSRMFYRVVGHHHRPAVYRVPLRDVLKLLDSLPLDEAVYDQSADRR